MLLLDIHISDRCQISDTNKSAGFAIWNGFVKSEWVSVGRCCIVWDQLCSWMVDQCISVSCSKACCALIGFIKCRHKLQVNVLVYCNVCTSDGAMLFFCKNCQFSQNLFVNNASWLISDLHLDWFDGGIRMTWTLILVWFVFPYLFDKFPGSVYCSEPSWLGQTGCIPCAVKPPACSVRSLGCVAGSDLGFIKQWLSGIRYAIKIKCGIWL
jgi:hypothetical protein